jgi:hypothetical protein
MKQGEQPSNFAATSNKYNLSQILSHNRLERGKDDSSLEAHL